MADLFNELAQKITGKRLRIVFPEGEDERIAQAAERLAKEGLITPVVINASKEIEGCEHVSPDTYPGFEDLVEAFVERRKGKATAEQAREQLKDPNYFGTMLVYTGNAHGLVSGAAHTTADTVRPALQIIKTKEGVSKTSGAFIMTKGEDRYIFADCAITVAPTAEDLAEIAAESAKTARAFGINPKVALLSFSTKGSAVTEETEKVAEATELAKQRLGDTPVDGEMQFDAAFVPSVAEKKAPDSPLKGQANVFVFPSLEAGNISYKIAQRIGGMEAVGPILQGLNAPVNDLSRGCSVEDAYNLALITAAQSLPEGE
ncbi:phosphate acetyltransferase [Planococcus lenghuensis]|uniref:Phosphate acetyltransferase n=1 Tax=Planococcus lenghuensis TaxID=2213202 RepID=A0A1Q2L1J6_9BACL|nr:phosphate acetyltransferase [Planococcus lenghuensis]AQQ54328.1 phosphate acetyltransferase [Planococcus lenghuensis]